MPKSAPKRMAIVGGGFSGVMTAVNLARFSTHPLEITVINRGRPAGRGVAYGTRHPEHLLNVAARNMSAFRDEPDHFLRWLRTRSEFDTLPEIELRERFIPRMVYGDYLRSIMHPCHLSSRLVSHSHFRGIEYPDFPPPDVDLAGLGLEKLVELVQHHCALLHERNANPAIIVDKMRPHTRRIWSRFTREVSETPWDIYSMRPASWQIFR